MAEIPTWEPGIWPRDDPLPATGRFWGLAAS